MAPLVVGLLFATGWILATSIDGWHHLLLTAAAALLVWKTRLHLLVMIGVGAAVGALGFV
jgi:chromate transporter